VIGVLKIFKNMKSMVVLLTVILFTVSSFAEPVDYTSLRRTELEQIGEELAPEFNFIQEVVSNNFRGYDQERMLTAVSALGSYPFSECALALWALYKYQTLELRVKNQDVEVKKAVIEALKSMANASDKTLLNQMMDLTTKISKRKDIYPEDYPEAVKAKHLNMNLVANGMSVIRSKKKGSL
tara:strand:+ start:1694 stop:2239 length:546 start_codon:yes stop_codon:yes gene_type:complete